MYTPPERLNPVVNFLIVLIVMQLIGDQIYGHNQPPEKNLLSTDIDYINFVALSSFAPEYEKIGK
jgi:hypothetical protein